jgi:hypothetical protein
MVVGGVVISGHAQAPSTTPLATPERPTFTATVVTTNGVGEIRDVVVRFGNGWELRADTLTLDGTPRRRAEGQGPTTITQLSSFHLEQGQDVTPVPTEAMLSGNVRLTMGLQ